MNTQARSIAIVHLLLDRYGELPAMTKDEMKY